MRLLAETFRTAFGLSTGVGRAGCSKHVASHAPCLTDTGIPPIENVKMDVKKPRCGRGVPLANRCFEHLLLTMPLNRGAVKRFIRYLQSP